MKSARTHTETASASRLRARCRKTPVAALVALLVACALPRAAAPADPFSPLPAAQAEAARALLDQLRHDLETEQPLPETAARGAVPDAELVEYVAADAAEAERIRAELAALRALLEETDARRAARMRELTLWRAFADRVHNDPALADAWLPAVRARAALEGEIAALDREQARLKSRLEERRVNLSLVRVSRRFGALDWSVIVFYLVFTTILGALLAGKQATIRDFFLGGRSLPWPAVCGSIIATELSAATFLIAPAIVFSRGGDMTYLLLAIGTILARFIIGYFFVPAFYEREIYSPYDYMGHRLGERVKTLTTMLFMLGAVLAQGARVYIAALALQVITGTTLWWSIGLIGAVSILWTFMGGIRTVIWTDVIQFLLFLGGAAAALVAVSFAVEGGFASIVSESYQAGKLNLVNLNLNTKEAFTLWCGLIASPFTTLASHGTDQMMAQRMFTCRDAVAARKAVIWSSLSLVATVLLLAVGAGLFVYYRHHPLTPAEQTVVDASSMKIFAIFIVDVLPAGLSGLLMAGIFAAAISTLDSVLAALAQSSIETVYKPWFKPTGDERRFVTVSRVLVVFWGVAMTAFAIYCHQLQARFPDLIQFALAMAAYTYGALLGTFLLAFLPTRRDDLGLLWGVPLAVLLVFALNWHTPVAMWIVTLACLVLVIQAFRHLHDAPAKVLVVGIACVVVLLVGLARIGTDAGGAPVYITVAWPWHFPIGTAMTFAVGYLVGRPRNVPLAPA